MKNILFIFKLLKHHNILQLFFKDYLLRNGKLYKGFSDTPFTGIIKIPNGKETFLNITNYENGLAHGLSQSLFLDGSVKQTGMYEKGNRTGKWIGYYPDGSIDYTITKTYKEEMSGELTTKAK